MQDRQVTNRVRKLAHREALLDAIENVRGVEYRGWNMHGPTNRALCINVKLHNWPNTDDIENRYKSWLLSRDEDDIEPDDDGIDRQTKSLSDFHLYEREWERISGIAWERTVEDWWEQAREIARDSDIFSGADSVGRSGGWLVPYTGSGRNLATTNYVHQDDLDHREYTPFDGIPIESRVPSSIKGKWGDAFASFNKDCAFPHTTDLMKLLAFVQAIDALYQEASAWLRMNTIDAVDQEMDEANDESGECDMPESITHMPRTTEWRPDLMRQVVI